MGSIKFVNTNAMDSVKFTQVKVMNSGSIRGQESVPRTDGDRK